MTGHRNPRAKRSSYFGLRFLFALLCLSSGIALVAQESRPSQSRLDKLRQEIQRSEYRLEVLQKQSARSEVAAKEVERQASALDSLIYQLEVREGTLATEMITLRKVRDSLSEVRQNRQAEYVRVARALFKRFLLTPSISMLLLPDEQRKLALAEVLFRRYTKRQKELGDEIIALTDSLDGRDAELRQRRDLQLSLLRERKHEAGRLRDLEKKYTAELQKTERERTSLESYLNQKAQEAKLLEQKILALAKERENTSRKEGATSTSTLSARNSKTNSPQQKANPDQSASRRKSSKASSFRLRWPVGERKILQGYGERKNSRTNTVTFNPGINIAASQGSNVAAAESGTVSLVSWMAGYGTIVIIEHVDGWRTVYANLAVASVSEGRSVSKGESIGTVGSSIDGDYLHFEVWHGQNRENPLQHLPK